MRLFVLGSIMSAGGCASVEYRVPSWEVEQLTQVPPATRGSEVRVVPVNSVVPPPPVAAAPSPPPPEVEVGVDLDLDVPVVVAHAPPPVIVAPRPVGIRLVGATVARPARPVGGGWRPPSANSGGWRAAGTTARPGVTRAGSSGGGRHGGGGGGRAAGAAAGAVAAVALIAIVADAAATAAAADAARRYDGWVAVDAGHPLHLYYRGDLTRVVPLARLAPADLIGLQYAVLEEYDGHVQPLQEAPPPPAAPPPRSPPAALPPPLLVSPPPPAPVAVQPTAPPSSPAPSPSPAPQAVPASQAIERESP